MIKSIKFSNFTVFRDLELKFSQGINIFIGENGTGKTHVLKALYSAGCAIDYKGKDFAEKLEATFLPNSIGRLVHRTRGTANALVKVVRNNGDALGDRSIAIKISSKNKVNFSKNKWIEESPVSATFIPVKDMMANAPGFRSLYSERHIHFEEVYADIIDKAFLPASRGAVTKSQERLLSILSKAISGKVIQKNEQFYLKNKSGELEFTLLAEGYRKLGLLYQLILNGTLTHGSLLFWDEPEANLNPKLSRTIVQILMELQRMGVQIFIATHDYVLLKEFDLASRKDDNVSYFSLYRDETGDIKCNSTNDMQSIAPSAIEDTYNRLLDDEITFQMKNLQR